MLDSQYASREYGLARPWARGLIGFRVDPFIVFDVRRIVFGFLTPALLMFADALASVIGGDTKSFDWSTTGNMNASVSDDGTDAMSRIRHRSKGRPRISEESVLQYPVKQRRMPVDSRN
jgi:hypothetical protein